MTIVVVGSLHYDIIVDAPYRPRKGETVMGDRWYPKFGGKGGNQAIAASLAGAEARFVGAVGQDGFADLLRDTLLQNGIAIDHVATVTELGSGMSVATMDASGDYGAVVVSGANTMIDVAQFDSADLWRDAKVLILQNEIPEAVNIAAARAARARGLKVCINAAPWRSLPDELIEYVDILVVNAIEAEDMGSRAVQDLASAKDAAIALTTVVPTVVVTAGGDGVAWAVRGEHADALPARLVKLVSTHGAGDMFIGTLCHAIAQNIEIGSAIAAANEAASQHISASRS